MIRLTMKWDMIETGCNSMNSTELMPARFSEISVLQSNQFGRMQLNQ